MVGGGYIHMGKWQMDGWQKNIFSSVIFLCLSIAFIGYLLNISAYAAIIYVDAKSGAFAKAIAMAAPGDVLNLKSGIHHGSFIIEKPLQIIGAAGAIIDGGSHGSVITIIAEDVTISGLKIINSGDNLPDKNSGIFINKTAHRAVIKNNFLENNLIGIYLWGSDDVLVENNIVYGRKDLRVNERGNAIQLWNSDSSKIIANKIKYGRDGIYAMTTKKNSFRDNIIEETRFAVHYMYADDSLLAGNISRNNHIGYALMFSSHMEILDNLSINDRDHGIALNYANSSDFIGNKVFNSQNKCVFIYNSNKNKFIGNLFQSCNIGVHFTAGSERNIISENAFIANQTQVKYVGTKNLNWAANGRGNYWSDNPAFDLNSDGLADATYRPNDMVDRVVWAYPMAKLLLNSPAIQILRWAQASFPAIRPGGIYDSAPLMHPVMEIFETMEMIKADG